MQTTKMTGDAGKGREHDSLSREAFDQQGKLKGYRKTGTKAQGMPCLMHQIIADYRSMLVAA